MLSLFPLFIDGDAFPLHRVRAIYYTHKQFQFEKIPSDVIYYIWTFSIESSILPPFVVHKQIQSERMPIYLIIVEKITSSSFRSN